MANEDGERRRHLRFECCGRAEIQSLASGRSMRGGIANLSLRGCLIDPREEHSFRRGERVEMTFCVRQLPVRVQGAVRQVCADRSVGVEFMLLNERGKRQLGELIGELAEILEERTHGLRTEKK